MRKRYAFLSAFLSFLHFFSRDANPHWHTDMTSCERLLADESNAGLCEGWTKTCCSATIPVMQDWQAEYILLLLLEQPEPAQSGRALCQRRWRNHWQWGFIQRFLEGYPSSSIFAALNFWMLHEPNQVVLVCLAISTAVNSIITNRK